MANAKNIHEYLIEVGEVQKTRKLKIKKEEEAKMMSDPHVDTHSTRMLETTKMNILESVFDKIDSDGDGQISADNMDLEALDLGLLEFFKPILGIVQESEEPVSKDEFMDLSLKQYSELPPSERRVIFTEKESGRPSKKFDENLTFKPFISQQSRAMARDKGPIS